MSSPADVTIKNLTDKELTTHVTRDYWVEGDGKTINNKTIAAGAQETFRVVAKTGHHGELDINLADPSETLGQFKIKSIKDPHNKGALETKPFVDYIKMTSSGERSSPSDKDLRRIEMEMSYKPSDTSGWDIVCASQKSFINEKLNNLYKQDVLPHTFKEVNIGCPQIVGGNENKQEEVKISLPLDGKITLAKISGTCEFTVNLNHINCHITNTDDAQYTLLLDLSGNILREVDLSGLEVKFLGKEVPTEQLQEVILKLVNEAFNAMEPLEVPFTSPLPFSLGDMTIRLAFVSNSDEPERSFLAILIGLQANKGFYKLSKDLICNSPQTNTAFVLAHPLFMNICKDVLNTSLGDGFGFSISNTNPNKITNSKKKTLKDGGFWGINAEIKKDDFVFELTSDGNLKVDIKLRYQTSKLLPWSSVKIKLNIKPSTKNGQVVLDISGAGKPPWWLWVVLPPLALALDLILSKDGKIELTIPGFYCDQILIPGNVKICGKWD